MGALALDGCSLRSLDDLSNHVGAGASSGSQGGAADVSSASSAGGGASSSTGAGAAGGASCAPCAGADLCILKDDFDDGTVDLLWNQYGSCGAETNGQFVVSPSANGIEYCGLVAKTTLPLGCQGAFVKVVEATAPLFGCDTQFVLTIDDANSLLLAANNGKLQLEVRVADVVASYDLGFYMAATDVWWRYVNDDGTLLVQTSPDGVSYVTRHSEPMPFEQPLTPLLQAGAYVDLMGTEPGKARFDCFNQPPPCGN